VFAFKRLRLHASQSTGAGAAVRLQQCITAGQVQPAVHRRASAACSAPPQGKRSLPAAPVESGQALPAMPYSPPETPPPHLTLTMGLLPGKMFCWAMMICPACF
jgi:hypothetical protein